VRLALAGLRKNSSRRSGPRRASGFASVSSALLTAAGESWVADGGWMRHANGMPETPVLNCVLLWARPGMEAALSAYEDKVLRLVAEHGGRVLERGTVLPGSQHDGEPPTEVQFLEMPSEASLAAYMNDPRRLAMAAERDAAIARTDLFRIQR
jgi:uncharacterized protein (DUF1330 family)